MLVTDATWAETHPVRRALVQPLCAWRCVSWTDEQTNFWVIAPRRLPESGDLPDGWLLGGPEALLEFTSHLRAEELSVYVFDGKVKLRQVTGLWRKRDDPDGMQGYWYGVAGGKLKPCYRSKRLITPGPEFECERQFASAPAAGRDAQRAGVA